jgi:hypothetical protein
MNDIPLVRARLDEEYEVAEERLGSGNIPQPGGAMELLPSSTTARSTKRSSEPKLLSRGKSVATAEREKDRRIRQLERSGGRPRSRSERVPHPRAAKPGVFPIAGHPPRECQNHFFWASCYHPYS